MSKKGDEAAYPHVTPVMVRSQRGDFLEKAGEQFHSGLTKREEFAKAIMAGIAGISLDEEDAQHNARCAVIQADALIAELEKEK